MRIEELISLDEVFFIDFETVKPGVACELGISSFNRKRQHSACHFNQVINPEINSNEYNIHHMRKHKVTDLMISKSLPIESHYESIRILLNNQIVLHWGGTDSTILNQLAIDKGLVPLHYSCFDLRSYLKGPKTLSFETQVISLAYHNAGFDAFMAAYVFATRFHNYRWTPSDQKYLASMDLRYEGSDETFKVTALQQGSGKNGNACLSGFSDSEKKLFANELIKIGFNVRCDVTRDLNYLVLPTPDYSRSPAKIARARELGAQIVTIDSLLTKFSKKAA